MDGIETDIDDFLNWGKDDNEHDKRLIQCLEKSRKIGLTLNSSKCQFKCDELTYLGYTISEDGINADANEIRAITEMPMPEDKKAVQPFIGNDQLCQKIHPKSCTNNKAIERIIEKRD